MSLPYNKTLIPRARELRRDMTPQERKLWYDFLLGFRYRFQRQKTIGCYIVDFFCAAAKLAAEVDGARHYGDENVEYDEIRTSELAGLGVAVMRIPNSEVERNFSEVCLRIESVVLARLSTPEALP